MAKYIDADHLKVEIEKHIKEVKDAAKRFTPNIGFFDAKLSGIYDVIAIIDSLQQKQPEKPMNQEGLEKEIERWDSDNADDNGFYNRIDFARHFYDLGCRRTAEKYDEIEYNRQRAEEHLATSGKTLEIKPGDEVTINGHKVAYDKDKDAITMEAIPNDLEEAAVKWSKENTRGFVLKDKTTRYVGDTIDAFIAGAKWQADHAPLPEDTVLFNKGVEEGKRLMMEEGGK